MKELIIEEIRREGPMPVSRYMDLCLYHPQQGYYMTRAPMAEGGDFVTAPEMTQAFGEVLGAWVADCWQKLGSPTAWVLVELGPGRGTLMQDILRVLEKHVPQAYVGLAVHLVELSPVLQKMQQEALKGRAVRGASGTDALPDFAGPVVVVANEFWDALPINQFVRGDDGYHERLVTTDGTGELVFTLSPKAVPLPNHTADVVELCPALPALVEKLKNLTTAGTYQLYIDYGAEGTADTLQALHKHAFTHPLTHPGEADLTAHVNFAALKEEFGESWAYTDQAAFLFKLGFPVRAAKLMDAAKTPQEREKTALNCAKLLAPDGMGGLFKVGCFYTKGLPAPAGF